MSDDTSKSVDRYLGGLPSQSHDADVAAARLRIQARIARNDPAPSTDQFMRGAPPAAPIESSVAQQASQHFVGQQLQNLWGSDFEANMGYAKLGYQRLLQENPTALARLVEIAEEDSASDAALTKLAASFGRTLDLAAPTYTPAPAPAYQPTPSRGTPTVIDDLDYQISTLTKQMMAARDRMDTDEVQHLNKQIYRLCELKSGTGTRNVSGHMRTGADGVLRGHGE